MTIPRPLRFVFAVALLAACSETGDPAYPSLSGDPAFATVSALCAPAWEPSVAYERGAVVTYVGHQWSAKKANQGIAPGSHPAYWGDQGACGGGGGDPPPPPPPSPMQILGVWHAGKDYAKWDAPRSLAEFDQANHWIIDRGDGRPSVNLVVLSFLQPLKVLNRTTDASTLNGVPRGMTPEIVAYFRNAGIRVMMSIGGLTYIDFWNQALATDPTRLGVNAAAIAREFGVGIEIDYEENTNANLSGLQAFVNAYRSVHPYDATGANPAARLTIDLAAGGRYLQDLNRYATINWLNNANPVLDYANAMVTRASGTPDNWQEHIDGMPTYGPPIPPKAPNRLTAGLYLSGDIANCTDFPASEQNRHAVYVQSVAPNGAGQTAGLLGFMFWAAETPSARRSYVSTTPPNSCERGVGAAATAFGLAGPMLPLRQN